MPNLKKVFLSLLTSTILFSGSVAPTLAAWYDQSLQEFSTKVLDESNNDIFGERYTYAQVQWIGYSILTLLIGDISQLTQNISADSSYDRDQPNIAFGESALGLLLSPIDLIYANMPASGASWISEKVASMFSVDTAHAQTGFGYNSLSAFQTIWRASRNIAYVVVTIIVLGMAFAIMFRVKLNPQTAVSIQNFLPKLVISIILITFSYAIVGFVIDLMYLVFYVVVYSFDLFGGTPSISNLPSEFASQFTTATWIDLLGYVVGQGLEGVGKAFTGPLVGTGLAAILTAIFASPVLVAISPALLPVLLALAIGIIVFLFKLIIMLAQTYLSLILNLVVGPFIILADILPGKESKTLGWLRSVIADVLVFLAVGLLIFLQLILNDVIHVGSGDLWGAPYIGNSANFIKGILALGVISILPNVRQVVYQFMQKRSLDVQSPREFAGVGKAVGELPQNVYGKITGLAKK